MERAPDAERPNAAGTRAGGAASLLRPRELSRLVALDSSSPQLSVAAGAPGRIIAQRQATASRSSAAIMELLDGCLGDAGLTPGVIEGLIVLDGPGSYTGLRVGMALAMGLHQALALPVGTLSTFEALAAAAPTEPARVVAAVRSGRDRWRLREFATGSPRSATGEPQGASDEEVIGRSRGVLVIGFGLGRLVGDDSRARPTDEIGLLEPPPLAATALALAEHASWSPHGLTRPRYLAPPPADPAARRPPE